MRDTRLLQNQSGIRRLVKKIGRGGPESVTLSDETAPWRSRLGTGYRDFIASHVPDGRAAG